ncbi:MAG: polysaccharide deacetylase family protein, partial [Clostridium sp.]|nr:polysaccharide deacetylase family protein [Clostridium sp.]
LAAQQAALAAQQAALPTQGIRQLDPNRPMVALTFDDGPYAKVGNRIMDCAALYNAKVTFYVVGDRVNTYASEMRRMVNEGHEVGNHTMNHKILTKLGAGEIASQIEKCNQAVQNVTGIRPRTVRLPGGGKNSTVLANISQPIILWNLDTLDWKHRNAATSVQKVLSSVKDGDVILMHELYTASADAACQLIPELTARGYQLVTVSELAQYRGGLNNNRVYYSFGR